MSIPHATWYPIAGYPGYEVNHLGQVRGKRNDVFLQPDRFSRVRLDNGQARCRRAVYIGECMRLAGLLKSKEELRRGLKDDDMPDQQEPDMENRLRALVEQGLTQEQLADAFSKSKSGIQYLLKKYSVQTAGQKAVAAKKAKAFELYRSQCKTPAPLATRKCHDCGKPTNDYRCANCREKWRVKHHVSVSAWDGEEVEL